MWTEDHCTALRRYVDRGMTYSTIAFQMSMDFQREFTRNACIGKAQRMGWASGRPPSDDLKAKQVERNKLRWREKDQRRKAERWAAKPSLAYRKPRRSSEEVKVERQEIARRIAASGAPKTCARYRNQLPRLPEMSKSELRAMLAAAVVNTAQMEQA